MGAWQGAQPGYLRNLNERAVYRAVREHPPITGAGIARRTNLSKPTVSTVLRILTDAGLVVESAKPFAGPGIYFEPVASAALAVGVEVQRNAVRAVLTDLAGTELKSVVVDGSHSTAEAVFQGVETAVASLLQRRRHLLRSVVVGAPGIIDPRTGLLRNSGVVPSLDGTKPAAALTERLGTEVSVVNDVDLAAQGEQAVGCGRGLRHFAVVHIGEGMGAALVLNGQLYEGAHGGAGEIDDIPFRRLIRAQPSVSPALDGLVGLAGRLAAGHPGSVLRPPYTAEAVHLAAEAGDALALEVLDRLAEWTSWFVEALTAVVDPEAVVLAGTIGARPELAEGVRVRLARHAPTVPDVLVSSLGDRSVLAGAIAVAGARAMALRLDELQTRSA